MDVVGFCRQAHVVVVAGKGGVGKTTVAATLALTAARSGLDVLVVGLDDAGGMPGLYGLPASLRYEPTLLAPNELVDAAPGRVQGRMLTSDAALLEYLEDHGMGRVGRRLLSGGTLEVIATAIPGIREVLVLGKLKQLELAGAADLIVVDAPATGHAMTFLTSSAGLVDAARGGPLRSQAEQVVAMLSDPARTSVLLVTIPEETPVNELIETAYRIEDEVGVKLGPIVVNGCYPERRQLGRDPREAAAEIGVTLPDRAAEALARAAALSRARAELETEQVRRLARELPLPQLRLPQLFRASAGPIELDRLAASLRSGIEAL